MKKNYSLPDDNGAAPSYDFGVGAVLPAPAAANDGLIFDDGEPFALATTTTSGSVSAGSAKPVATIATLADYLINGFWQYNSSIAHHWTTSTVTYNINGLNAAEQFLAQSALQAWHDVANISFVLTTSAANITFVDTGSMQAVTNASWYSNGAMASANVDISADWITNDGGAMDGKTGIDSYGYQTYIHEIGHALGLGHQGPYNGSAVYSTNALYADDTWQYSIMSYFAQNNYSGSTYRYVVSPQMADIYAVGQMYGADSTTRTGDTVYGFHSTAGAVYDFGAYTRAPSLTIYDSGGNNTLDCSGYSVAQTIDLHAGAFSSVGGLVNNIGIALGTNINTAIGGSGNDTLIANDNGCTLIGGAGNDTMIGGVGNDRLIAGSGIDFMTGGAGADTFVFTAGHVTAASGQHDRITGFVSGTDKIDLSGLDAIVATAGIDQFRFIGTAAFDGSAGELDYYYNSTLGVTVVQGDTNGDRVADFAIDLTGNIALSIADLIGAYSTAIFLTPTTAQAVQGGAAVGLLNGSPTIADASSTTLSSVTIKVSAAAGNIFPGDELYINGAQSGTVDGGRVTVSWNDSTKILTLSGVASISDYQTLLGLVSYQWTGIDYSTGTHTPHTVTWTLNDGSVSFGTTSLITIERPPVATVSNITLNASATTVAASSLLTVSDPDGDAVVTYAFKDTGPGHFVLNNVVQPNGQEIDVTATQLSQLMYSSWGDTDSVQVRVSDGTLWSSWQTFTITGPTPTVIESLGSTSLVQVGSNYFLNPVAGGTGPELKSSGVAIAAGQFGGWSPIGVEQTATGYEVAWKLAGADAYSVWNTDSNGNYTSSAIGNASGSSPALEAIETSFHQDLNGDGTIGLVATIIESFGSTSLVQVGSNYFFNPVAGGTGPELKSSGVAIAAGQFGGWSPIGVEQTATGYEVAWKLAGADAYSVWNTDSNGNYTSSAIGNASGSSVALEAIETSFHQDLNGDGTIGLVATTIEAFGSTSLVQVGSNYFLNPVAGGAGPELKSSDVAIAAGQFGGWSPIGVEQTATGYEVAWKLAGADAYSVWNTDSNGNYTSSAIGNASGSSPALEAIETSFHQDLNGDGTIGLVATIIESFGSTSLVQVGSNYFFNPVAGGTGPELKSSGVAIAAGQFGGWSPIGVEQTATGYEVAWKLAGADAYSVWNTDSNGNYTSSAIGNASGSSVALEAIETSFHQDLNGDGVIGINAAILHASSFIIH